MIQKLLCLVLNLGQESQTFKLRKASQLYCVQDRDSDNEAEWHSAKVKLKWRHILGPAATFIAIIELNFEFRQIKLIRK